ncbi:CheY-like chemotaxis protein [Luteibacter sp. W1I16]|uniref:response regulator n=1 Tax=Luteibacter sp. W1I16 TaxID=3373922 RepID=UPI003D25B27B
MVELIGLRALVVEDEGGVALLIEAMLEELGCEVVASVGSLSKALEIAESESFDLAVLDVNIVGGLVFPVAEVLRRRRLPFVFSTGYGRMGVPDVFKDCAVLSKPFAMADLKQALRLALQQPC